MASSIDQVYRDYNTAGVPASGDWKPKKSEIRALLKQILNSGGQSVTRNTYAVLSGVTPPTEDYMGIVLDDPDVTKNGYYSRVSSAWVWERGFPDTFAELTVAGTGTARTASVSAGVNPADAKVYFASVNADNTGAITLSIAGGVARDVVNAAGNPLTAGEWTGVVLFFLNGSNQYQLINDAGAAAAAAASASAADADRIAAEAAASIAGGFASALLLAENTFSSKAIAEAWEPAAGPDYIRLAGYASAGDGGGALYKKVVSEPAHSGKFSITLDDAVTVVWYEIATDVLRPEMFGQIGVSGAGDTAAWLALAGTAAAATQGLVTRIEAGGQYEIVGQITFTNLPAGTVVDLRRASFQQTQRFATTIKFNSSCVDPVVYGGKMYGFAALEIAASPGTRPTEFAYDGTAPFNPADPDATYDPDSGFYNGVAGIAFSGCGLVTLDGGDFVQHCGGAVYISACSSIVRNVKSRGIGSNYINPIDNGSDFAVNASGGGQSPGPEQHSHDWSGFDIADHAFCMGGSYFRRVHSYSHKSLSCVGQHISYYQEVDELVNHDYHMGYAPQAGIKYQYTNYVVEAAAEWLTATNYTAGQEVKRNAVLYVCLVNHTSGTFETDLAAAKWVVSPKMIRRNHVIHDLTSDGCGFPILYVTPPIAFGTETYVDGIVLSNLNFRNSIVAIRLDRCKAAKAKNIRIQDSEQVGFAGYDIGGDFEMTIERSGNYGIDIAPAWATNIKARVIDTAVAEPVRLQNWSDAMTVPSHDPRPLVELDLDIENTVGEIPATNCVVSANFNRVYQVRLRARKDTGPGLTPSNSARSASYALTQA